MIHDILHVLEHTLLDSLKILPFLFLTYLVMEYLEHKMNNKTKKIVERAGNYGPLLGGLLGAVPQCGFSVSATNLYAGRIITLGTLIAIYLSTSDEMLPLLISNGMSIGLIIKILSIKVLIGIIAGFAIDFCIRLLKKKKEEAKIESLCEHEHCHCENGILKSAIKHTLSVMLYIVIFSLILNIVIELIGEDNIAGLILNKSFLGPIIVGLVGLIPNCASSVIITELYISGVINLATMLAGLLVNSGISLVVLFRVNKNIKENIKIIGILYAIGVISGIVLDFFLKI
ncbi:MAG: hypothetical protein E7310_01155 [Clostridiales bacterium]|nr:hypothetical protein [Clostridiales bacterium]